MHQPIEKINFAFWGTPDVASETLQILKGAGYVPALIITAPDKPQGRKMVVTPPPVKVWAEKNNIPYIQTENPDVSKFDLSIVVAYGKIIPENILNAPRLGSINIHYSLLPKYRGASPVESAILNGETETGITIQKMAFAMDSGPIIAKKEVSILPEETAPELRQRLIKIGGELLVKILPDVILGKLKEMPQNENEATFCKKIKKEYGLIDLEGDAIGNYNKFRAYAHWPRTFFFRQHLPTGRQERIIITKARLENGKFLIEKVIPEGGKEIDFKNLI